MKKKLFWKNFLRDEKKQLYFRKILFFLKKEKKKNKIIFPKEKNIFKVFRLTELHEVKVVILGQDPYSKINQANGLAFSVGLGQPLPPSLRNIYKELHRSKLKNFNFRSGSLTHWSRQGVFLLNTVLTVEKNKPGSHFNIGWETFTDKVIEVISKNKKNVIFVLWGSIAQKKEKIINSQHHYVLKSSHPSPLSAYRGFFGCNHFSRINQLLINIKKKPIIW